MTVHVRLFAAAREFAGSHRLAVELPERATIGDLRRRVVEVVPVLESIVRHSLWAVGAEYVSDDVELHANADVALIPPVSGG
jgi:molybdopterin converting factor small subunit